MSRTTSLAGAIGRRTLLSRAPITCGSATTSQNWCRTPQRRQIATTAVRLQDDAGDWTEGLEAVLGTRAPTKSSEVKEALLSAMQNSNYMSALQLLSAPASAAALKEAIVELPDATFTALLQFLDPFKLGPNVDPAHERHIRAPTRWHTDAPNINDKYGVRRLYQDLIPVLLRSFFARVDAKKMPVNADFAVLLRYAGASQDVYLSRTIWNMMLEWGLTNDRNVALYADFIEARFLVHDLYHQFDKHRLRIMYHLLHGDQRQFTMPRSVLLEYAKMRGRFSMHATDKYGLALQRNMSSKGVWYEAEVQRFFRPGQPVTQILLHQQLCFRWQNERTFSALITAYARSGRRSMILFLFRRVYGIRIKEHNPRKRHNSIAAGEEALVDGGFRIPKSSPKYPTERLLVAVAESLGPFGNVSLCIKLIFHISSRYGVPITRVVWKSVFLWASICSLPHCKREWELWAEWRQITDKIGAVRPEEIQLIWDTMTSEPYNVVPDWECREIYVGSLFQSHKFDEALGRMDEYKKELDELFLRQVQAYETWQQSKHLDAPDLSSQLYHAWQKLKMEEGFVKNLFTHWLAIFNGTIAKLAKSPQRSTDKHSLAAITIPNVVLRYRNLILPRFEYPTPTGVVTLVHDYLGDSLISSRMEKMDSRDVWFYDLERVDPNRKMNRKWNVRRKTVRFKLKRLAFEPKVKFASGPVLVPPMRDPFVVAELVPPSEGQREPKKLEDLLM